MGSMKMDINELFDSEIVDTTHVQVARVKLQGLKDIGVSLDDVKKDGIHFYLDGKKEFHTLLLPKFYAALVMASECNEEDAIGSEYHDKGEYSFLFRITIPLKEDPSKEALYYLWFVLNNVDGIYVELLVPYGINGEVATFEDCVNPLGELQQMMQELANIWMLNFQEKGLIPYPYAKFIDSLSIMFGFCKKDEKYFCNHYKDKQAYTMEKTAMLKDLIKDLH